LNEYFLDDILQHYLARQDEKAMQFHPEIGGIVSTILSGSNLNPFIYLDRNYQIPLDNGVVCLVLNWGIYS